MKKIRSDVIFFTCLIAAALGVIVWGLWFILTFDMFPAIDYDAMYLSEEGGEENLIRVIEEKLWCHDLLSDVQAPHFYSRGGKGANYLGAFRTDPDEAGALLDAILERWSIQRSDRTMVRLSEAPRQVVYYPDRTPRSVRAWFAPQDRPLSMWHKSREGPMGITWLVDEDTGEFWFVYLKD